VAQGSFGDPERDRLIAELERVRADQDRAAKDYVVVAKEVLTLHRALVFLRETIDSLLDGVHVEMAQAVAEKRASAVPSEGPAD
jgi:hypothetical protein